MLHALNHRKIRLENFRPASEAERLEDLIVSTVFGPWSLLPLPDQLGLLHGLCERAAVSATVLEAVQRANSATVEFWPRIDASHLGRRHVEPDVLWRLSSTSCAPVLLMLEAKWNSPLGDQQLEQQRNALARSEPQAMIAHLLLTRRQDQETRDAFHAAQRFGETGWIRWDHVLSAIRDGCPAMYQQIQPMMRTLEEWDFRGVDIGRLATLDLSALRNWNVQVLDDLRWPKPSRIAGPKWDFNG